MNGLAVDPLDSALVRLRDGRRVLGAGFLIAPDVVATCAHVLGEATPTADFPLLGSDGHDVEVLERDDERDIAILRITDPPVGALPVPARISGEVRDHRFRTFGFPAEESDGIWVTGRLLGARGGGRIQMAQDTGHWLIEPGFSGAPVWDEELAGVVGMVVTARRDAATAHLVPTTALGDAWTAPVRNPYRGLRSFRQEDAELFRGRDTDIERLAGLVVERRLVAVAGPSGSGKSSLVRAGLVPKLQQAGTSVVELGSHDDIPDTDGLLVLDQFEEAVVADPAAARQRLTELAAALARRPSLRAVLTLRSRSLDELISNDTAEDLNRAVWFLEPMSRDQLAAAVEEPAAAIGGLAFEAGLVQRILDDAGDGTLPLVSLVLEQLWENRHGAWLTHDAYEHLGRVPGALSRHADGALPEPDEHDTPRQAERKQQRRNRIRQLLIGLTRPDGEGGYARRSAHLDDLDTDLRDTARALAAERLVVVEDEVVNLAHQALIDHWPQLRTWLDEDTDFLTWLAAARDLETTGVLLRDAALTEATTWLGTRANDIPTHLRTYIERSTAAHRRSRRRWMTITAASSALALVSMALTGVVISNSAELDRNLRATNSTLIAQHADLATDPEPASALQLALAAWRENPGGADAYGALLKQRMVWSGVDRALPPQLVGEVTELKTSADGRVVVLVHSSTQATVWWNLLGREPVQRDITTPSEGDFELSPDGRTLVFSGYDEGLHVWDLHVPVSGPVVLDSRGFHDPTFSANSRYLTVLSDSDGQSGSPVRMWDLHTMRESPTGVKWVEGNEREQSIIQIHPSDDGRALVALEHRGPDEDYRRTPVVRDRESGADIKTYPPTAARADLLGNGTHFAVSTNGFVTVRDSFTGAVADRFPVADDWNRPDETGEYLILDGTDVINALHWRTGRVVSWPGLDNSVGVEGSAVVAGTFLHSYGGSVRVTGAAVDRATAWSAPPEQPTRREVRSPDGKRWIVFDDLPVFSDDVGDLVLVDSKGRQLARRSLANGSGEFTFDGSGEHLLISNEHTLRVYRTDGLVPRFEVSLPLPEGAGQSEPSSVGGPYLINAPNGDVLVSHSGVLSFWDVRTGLQSAPPLLLEQPDDRATVLPSGPIIVPRLGHPDQVLVRADDSIALWDYRRRIRLYQWPVDENASGNDAPVVSEDGSIAAMPDVSNAAATLIDLRSGALLPPLNGNFNRVIGVSGQYLFSDGGAGTDVWDWHSRRRLATIPSSPLGPPELISGELVVEQPDLRRAIPLDPDVWFRDLCRISDREFTGQEAALLPAGSSRDRPCA